MQSNGILGLPPVFFFSIVISIKVLKRQFSSFCGSTSFFVNFKLFLPRIFCLQDFNHIVVPLHLFCSPFRLLSPSFAIYTHLENLQYFYTCLPSSWSTFPIRITQKLHIRLVYSIFRFLFSFSH